MRQTIFFRDPGHPGVSGNRPAVAFGNPRVLHAQNRNRGPVYPRPSNDEHFVTCFTPGTMITTSRGLVAVESLQQGDRVLTRDNGFQPVVWIGKRHIDAGNGPIDYSIRPVLVRADSFGDGLPARDMTVSPRHRLLTTNRAHLAGLSDNEALIEAHALVGQPGVSASAADSVTYIHLLFERHQVILGDNAWSESFHLADASLNAVQEAQKQELLTLFPELASTSEREFMPLARESLSALPLAI